MKRMTVIAVAVATFTMTQFAFASEDEANERGEYKHANWILGSVDNLCRCTALLA